MGASFVRLNRLPFESWKKAIHESAGSILATLTDKGDATLRQRTVRLPELLPYRHQRLPLRSKMVLLGIVKRSFMPSLSQRRDPDRER